MPIADPVARRRYSAKYMAKRRLTRPDLVMKERAVQTSKRLKNPEKYYHIQFKSRLKIKFGMTVEDYESRVVAQRGLCAICQKDAGGFTSKGVPGKSLTIDHCHTTGQIRGLLCGHCNALLGYAKDRIEVLQAAIQYLLDNDPREAVIVPKSTDAFAHLIDQPTEN